MAANATVNITFDDGEPLAKLNELIKQRAEILGEVVKDSVVATAINVVSSLKASTKKAPLKVSPDAYNIEQLPHQLGWRKRHRVARPHGADVEPFVNRMYGLRGQGYLYKVTMNSKTFGWEGTAHKGYYVVAAPNIAEAEKFARERVIRILRKESGMGKYALGIAQAKISTKASMEAKPSGANAWKKAFEAAKISTNETSSTWGEGSFGMEVLDDLNYSVAALKGGASALNMAMAKAANKTAGLLNRTIDGRGFGEKIETPFPEVLTRELK